MQIPPDRLEILRHFRSISYHVGKNILMKKRPDIIKNGRFDIKDDGHKVDQVTVADKASEKYIFSEIEKFDTNASNIGEEDGRTILNPNRFYIVDPLDGTGIFSGEVEKLAKTSEAIKDFGKFNITARPIDFQKYCVFLSYVENNESVVEMMYVPELKETAFAVKGIGAFYQHGNSKYIPLKVSEDKPISESVAAITYLRKVLKSDYQERFTPFINTMLKFPTLGSFGFTSAIYESMSTTLPKNASNGKPDVYLNPQQYLWDCPSLILNEAGGLAMMVTEKDGKISIDEFSHANFDITNKDSDLFKQPYGIASGNPYLVEKFVKNLENELK
ncbi:MAG: inositol monophosphatase family protein [archaeon]